MLQGARKDTQIVTSEWQRIQSGIDGFDGRETSRTAGQLMELHVGDARPAFLVIPPGVWHGLQNLGSADALMLNLPTHAYDYADPDHYRLAWDSPEIPYTWIPRGAGAPRRDPAPR